MRSEPSFNGLAEPFSMGNLGEQCFFLDSNDAHRLVFGMEWWRLVIHISDPKDVGSPLLYS
jgi:hypothetical protein